jgi:AcrR family transcriptional regulator
MFPGDLDFPRDYEHKMRFVAAIDNLLDDTSFDKLTVKTICEQTGVTRPVFYRYFHDKYEVIQWNSDLIAARGIFQIGRTLSWYDGYYLTCSGHRDLRHLYCKIASARGYQSLPRYSERVRKENLIHTVVDYHKLALTKSLLFQISALAVSETTLACRWMRDGMQASPTEMAEMFVQIVPPELGRIFDRASQHIETVTLGVTLS